MQDLSLIHISKWLIRGHPDYYFTADKKLFNRITNRFSKNVVRGYSSGYNLNGKFITKEKLKPLIFKEEIRSENNLNFIHIGENWLSELK